MRLAILASTLLPLALAGTAFAGQPKADVCHWTASGNYVLINVATNSAHFNAAIHPNDVVAGTFFLDADGDGFGDPDSPVYGCPGAGIVSNSDDCDDADAAVGDICAVEYRLFSLVEDEIVGIDTASGAAAPYLDPAITTAARHLTWDPNTEVFYTLENAITAPRLVSIDPCTGAVVGDVPLTSTSTVYFCEDLDFDRHNNRLVGACSLDGAIAQSDFVSESVIEIDPGTGVATFLAPASNNYQNDFDKLVFVGDSARTMDGSGTLASNRWYVTNSTTFTSSPLLHHSTPYGSLAWDWSNALFYNVTHPSAGAIDLQLEDPDSRATQAVVGPTGLEGLFASPNPTGTTFADFTCN